MTKFKVGRKVQAIDDGQTVFKFLSQLDTHFTVLIQYLMTVRKQLFATSVADQYADYRHCICAVHVLSALWPACQQLDKIHRMGKKHLFHNSVGTTETPLLKYFIHCVYYCQGLKQMEQTYMTRPFENLS